MVDGAFDPLHVGHLAYFTAASAIGAPILCNLAPDRYLRTKHPPLLPADQRLALLNSLRLIDFVHLSDHPTEIILAQAKPSAYVKGSDWAGTIPEIQREVCQRLGIRIVFVDTVKESSSRLLALYLAAQSGTQ